MIINEQGLAKALKKAHKKYGYVLLHNDDQITVYTDDWYVSAEREKFPIKALATVVEHLGGLPTSDAPMLLIKDEDPQYVLPESVEDGVNEWTKEQDGAVVRMVPMIVRGLQVFQQEEDLRCYGVDLRDVGIVDRVVATESPATEIGARIMKWESDGELILLSAKRPPAESWGKVSEKVVWEAIESVDLSRTDE